MSRRSSQQTEVDLWESFLDTRLSAVLNPRDEVDTWDAFLSTKLRSVIRVPSSSDRDATSSRPELPQQNQRLASEMNLLDLNYNEFEDLVTNLFNHMGYDSIGTSRSHDGGVDSIVYHHDPVFGGKVIVQAKRYKDKIGPGHLRELIGSLTIEKASKAILVTTSDFTDEARALKADYENIELINGNNLLQMLSEHAGIDARIDL